MLITFEIFLFGESYTERDAELFPTLDTDLTSRSCLTPPISLLLPAAVLGEVSGLPLNEFEVSDERYRVTVLKKDGRYLLPITSPRLEATEASIDDLGVNIRCTAMRVWGVDFLILRCDELSLLDKTLAPRLLTKAGCNAFIAYEKKSGATEFYALSPRIKKGLSPTAALILHTLLGTRRLSSGDSSFTFEYYNGKPHLSVKL